MNCKSEFYSNGIKENHVIELYSISSLDTEHSQQAFNGEFITYLCMLDINLLRRCSLCSGVSLVCTLKSLMILKSERILSVKPIKQEILSFLLILPFLCKQKDYYHSQTPLLPSATQIIDKRFHQVY